MFSLLKTFKNSALFFHPNKCNYMSLNVGIALPISEGNDVFPCSVLNLDMFWNYSISIGGQALVPSAIYVLYIHLSLTKI